jgi:phytoene dehydrogenase-like protein
MTTSEKFDAIIIGSGINSLVAGAVLGKAGWKVLICERNDSAGGAIKTEQATLPGYTHELLSSWHPLFVGGPAYADLKEELDKRGLVYKNTELPTGVVCSDGADLVVRQSGKFSNHETKSRKHSNS